MSVYAPIMRSTIPIITLALVVAAAGCARPRVPPPLTRNRQLESLERAVSWPHPSNRVVVTLAGEYLATHREREGFTYFDERARKDPDQTVFLALSGLFQARLAPEVPLLERAAWVEAAAAKLDRAAAGGRGLERAFRGLVFAGLPERFGRARQGALDLEWVLAHADAFPPGMRRGAWRGLASAYRTLGRAADAERARRLAGPETTPFLTDHSVNGADGFRFVPRDVRELPGGVLVASGYDFADSAFVAVEGGLVAIDAGTTAETAAEALAAVRTRTQAPLRAVIVTHAHWDHIGGLDAFVGPGVEVIAQADAAKELAVVNAVTPPFRFFFGDKVKPRFTLAPDRLISRPETVVIGGRSFGLYPAHGGETADALLVHLPDAGVVFAGDAFMPYFGAPFAPEGSIDGLFDTIAQIRTLAPKTLIHGHAPLTANFTAETMAPLAEALAVVRDHALEGAHRNRVLADLLEENLMPESLAAHPEAVLPFLLLRDNLIKRLHQQQTGYWKTDGEGMEVFTRAEWGRAVDLLADGAPDRFVDASRALETRGDFAMALRIAELGLAAHPGSADLAAARRRALEGLRLKYQADPFKLIIYSEMAGAPMSPVPPAR